MRAGCGGGEEAAEGPPEAQRVGGAWAEAAAAASGLRCEAERATADSGSGKGGDRELRSGEWACWLGASLAAWRRKWAEEGRRPRRPRPWRGSGVGGDLSPRRRVAAAGSLAPEASHRTQGCALGPEVSPSGPGQESSPRASSDSSTDWSFLRTAISFSVSL